MHWEVWLVIVRPAKDFDVNINCGVNRLWFYSFTLFQEESLATLELEYNIQTGIAEAARSLASDSTASKGARRKHRLVYQQSQRRLLEVEARLNLLRQASRCPLKQRKKPRPPLESGSLIKSRQLPFKFIIFSHRTVIETKKSVRRNTVPRLCAQYMFWSHCTSSSGVCT